VPSDLLTVQIRGGEPFEISLEGNPLFTHNGATTVQPLMITPEEEEALRGLALRAGSQIEFFRPGKPSEEQERIRSLLMGEAGAARVWPCVQCPTCPWANPFHEYPCGLDTMEAATIQGLMGDPLYEKAIEECPVA